MIIPHNIVNCDGPYWVSPGSININSYSIRPRRILAPTLSYEIEYLLGFNNILRTLWVVTGILQNKKELEKKSETLKCHSKDPLPDQTNTSFSSVKSRRAQGDPPEELQ